MALASFKSHSLLINTFHYVRPRVLLLCWCSPNVVRHTGERKTRLSTHNETFRLNNTASLHSRPLQNPASYMETNQQPNKHSTQKPEEKLDVLAQLACSSLWRDMRCVLMSVHVTALFKCFHRKKRKTKEKRRSLCFNVSWNVKVRQFRF